MISLTFWWYRPTTSYYLRVWVSASETSLLNFHGSPHVGWLINHRERRYTPWVAGVTFSDLEQARKGGKLPFGSSDSDSVTRVTVSGDSDSTQVTLRKRVNRLESQSMTRDSSQSFFAKFRSLWWKTQFVCTQRNEHFFVLVMIMIGVNFLFCLSSRAMLPVRD